MGWRRVLVSSSITLRELHGILQVAMGWDGIHLFQFDIRAVDYGSLELHAASPDVPLSGFGFYRNDRLSYIYDMGGATGLPVEAKIRFTSNILPKWARRSKSLDALLPVLYLRGISTGDFQEALSALLGPDAPNLSPGVIARLTAGWHGI